MKKITLSSSDNNQGNYSQETTVDELAQIMHNQDSVAEMSSQEFTTSHEQEQVATGITIKSIQSQQKDNLMTKKQKKIFITMCVIAIVAGVSTGFGASRLQTSQGSLAEKGPTPMQQIAEGKIQKGDVYGILDTETFSDEAKGYLLAGGINGEGSHRLLRPGGESQTVYLTSTVTDLDLLVGAEVKVWGETYQGQKAGWLMDVGKVEVLEVEGEAPFEEEL